MNEVKCELCAKNGEEWVLFGHSFCKECADKFKDYIQITVDIAEQERRHKSSLRLTINDISEFMQIKDGERDVVRTSIDYELGEVIDICYDGFAYKDEVKCKVIGCHKSASGGYIIELINL